ncbi:MBL fold metallo-hydrolase [Spongiactinospora sp. TRM90649]|uniref:MBL fold metallo-hydrolase n=1 Tax=Spongiactinospora sp. TRM90649 TaxID=3031114 RepID=UPI0023F8A375|nr:MBL fold metallo-hydrolase [Spongiactinospora sp. TRM90649]MDF5758889.1 MBL fold metallo-hydrolase [Spongiactinospora sp. TRM90649]
MSATSHEPDTRGVPDVSGGPAPIVRGEPVQVADGVHVIPDRRVELVPNVGIVVGERAALVIDTGMGPANGAYVLDQARRLAGDRRLYLTVTHFHPEHAFGAQAFAGEATIVYNRGQRDELRRKGAVYLGMFRGLGANIAGSLEGVELVDPDLIYDEEAELDLGGRTATLRPVGPAHTASDQVVLIDGRVLFAGDLLETRIFPITPYLPPHDTDVDPSRWIDVLDRLIALGPEVVVPGHGEVAGVSLIADVHGFLSYVRDEAARLRAAGRTGEQAAAEIDRAARARWSTWERPEWIAFAARACYDAAGRDV